MSVNNFQKEVLKNERFEFGKNWRNFLKKLNTSRIEIAELSLVAMLSKEKINGQTFLDIGSGSGLSSLAAKNLGANVTSFDYDESSVWCTNELKHKFYPNDKKWEISQGSILDKKFLNSLGKFNIVYSWGVLHHTGSMFEAIDNSIKLLEDGGLYFIAIYNDQGMKSKIWWFVKFIYNNLPNLLKKPFAFLSGFCLQLLMLIKYTFKLKPMLIINPILNYKKKRGMSMVSDILDWYGGFPFEYAKYETLIDYIERKDLKFIKGKKSLSSGCHELVFIKIKK